MLYLLQVYDITKAHSQPQLPCPVEKGLKRRQLHVFTWNVLPGGWFGPSEAAIPQLSRRWKPTLLATANKKEK